MYQLKLDSRCAKLSEISYKELTATIIKQVTNNDNAIFVTSKIAAFESTRNCASNVSNFLDIKDVSHTNRAIKVACRVKRGR